MPTGIRVKLSLMMFSQYFVWGAWWVTLGAYLNAQGFDDIIGKVYASQGYAAIVAPLFVGVIADRYFCAEKVLASLHLLGAVLLFWLSTITASPDLFFTVVLMYMMLYIPTLPLTNSVAFNAMNDTQKQFPAIRVLGTVGWIAAGLSVGFLQAEQSNLPIKIAASASIFAGLLALILPSTPPKDAGSKVNWRSITGLDVIVQIKQPAFWVFIFCSLLVCIPLSFYYAYTNTFLVEVGVKGAAAVQTLGQVSEILFMLILPFCFSRFGVKWVLLIGMLAWSLRYVAFAFGFNDSGAIMPMLLLGIVLHGVCYDLFFVAGQIYVDQSTSEHIRARAQSFLALVTLGIGTVIGSNLANTVYVSNAISATQHNWQIIWLIPAALAVLVALVFMLLFNEKRSTIADSPARAISS